MLTEITSLLWITQVFHLPQVNSTAQTNVSHCVWSHYQKQINRLMSELLLLTFTFCLASITLASRSAGMTLPLEKKKAAVSHPHIWSLTRDCKQTDLTRDQSACWSSIKQTSHPCSTGSGSLSRNPELHWLSWWNSGSAKNRCRSVATQVGFTLKILILIY